MGESKLVNRKANNYPHQGAFTVTPNWFQGELKSVDETAYNQTLSDRIVEVLRGGPKTAKEITAELAAAPASAQVKLDSVQKALRREVTKPVGQRWTVAGEKWRLLP